ncbi:histidine--tRNA ligase [Marinicauda pacifica]|uniref:Histidine--tRNA ligase n=1 Tax=Marinicauda pacifica TaxID=1133559 RepID=A0A4S2H7T1_9PROT|nr:histidine--tRNA ligase [Marinicauda pacifica]TGY91875.1 histidine--tRNA ligase [Marinicauda pacifica]GGE50065.1 histidine--tRNA ligase [Marinicauda pacifica]
MAKTKAFKPKARRPRGFEDRSANVLRAERALVRAASDVYEKWGFEPLETPAFEYADALGKFLPDEERPNEGVFAMQDEDEQWMALRYDLTAPLARFAAENFQDLTKPFRRYQFGEVWRNEKPGPGRFRQFVQCDADSVGAPGPAADAEIIALASEVMGAAGLGQGDYVIRVNDRRLLDGVLESLGASASEARMRVLRAIDKMDRLGREGVELLLGEGRKDESGDFTKGAGLDAGQRTRVLDFLEAGGGSRAEIIARLEAVVGDTAGAQGVEALTEIDAILRSLGVDETRAAFDPSIVRGLGYYTGPVFETELLATAQYEDGSPIRFGSIGGGGRYDDLVARFTGQAVPATGFSFGVSRFAAALSALDRLDAARPDPLVVVVAAEKDQMAEYFALAAELRAAGLRAEAFVGGGNMGKQLKYADRRGAAFAVIVGSEEREAGTVSVKDLALGAEIAAQLTDREEWAEQRQQFTVPRESLVSEIKARLSRD